MEGHKYLGKPIIKELSFDSNEKQGPYFLRRVHVFWKNECILEMDVTGFIHSIMPLANVGEVSFHIDAGESLDKLAQSKIKKYSIEERKIAKQKLYEKMGFYVKEGKMKMREILEKLKEDFKDDKIISSMLNKLQYRSLGENYRRFTKKVNKK